MKQFGTFLLGAFLLLITLTFSGGLSFIGIAFLYSYCLYRLFFSAGSPIAFALLTGITVAFELLGTNHFGSASGFALVIWALYEIFAARVRFTSIYARYIVAVLIMFLIYTFYFFAPSGSLYRLGMLALVMIPIALLSLYFSTSNREAEYELL